MRLFPMFLTVVYFVTNCAFAHAIETTIWGERRRNNAPPTAAAPWNPAVEKYLSLNDASENFPKNGSRLFLIQDIHQNREAQKNISQAMLEFLKNEKINTVALEGAFEPIDLTSFKMFPDQTAVQVAAGLMLERGRIPGSIHALLTTPEDLPAVIGVDDHEHYWKNVAAYRLTSHQMARRKAELAQTRLDLDQRKDRGLHPRLRQFDYNVDGFHRHQIDFQKYLAYLLTHFPAFKKHLEHLGKTSKLDLEKLLTEIDRWEEKLYAELIRSPEEQALITEGQLITLQEKLVTFSLSKKEWDKYQQLALSTELNPFEEFYRQAEFRDRAMAQALLREFKRRPNKTVLLVAGGFHSAGIISVLKKNGIPVRRLTPQSSSIDLKEGPTYMSVFNRGTAPLEQVLNGHQLFLAPQPFQRLTRFQTATEAARRGINLAASLSDRIAQLYGPLPQNIRIDQSSDSDIVLMVRGKDGTWRQARFDLTTGEIKKWAVPVGVALVSGITLALLGRTGFISKDLVTTVSFGLFPLATMYFTTLERLIRYADRRRLTRSTEDDDDTDELTTLLPRERDAAPYNDEDRANPPIPFNDEPLSQQAATVFRQNGELVHWRYRAPEHRPNNQLAESLLENMNGKPKKISKKVGREIVFVSDLLTGLNPITFNVLDADDARELVYGLLRSLGFHSKKARLRILQFIHSSDWREYWPRLQKTGWIHRAEVEQISILMRNANTLATELTTKRKSKSGPSPLTENIRSNWPLALQWLRGVTIIPFSEWGRFVRAVRDPVFREKWLFELHDDQSLAAIISRKESFNWALGIIETGTRWTGGYLTIGVIVLGALVLHAYINLFATYQLSEKKKGKNSFRPRDRVDRPGFSLQFSSLKRRVSINDEPPYVRFLEIYDLRFKPFKTEGSGGKEETVNLNIDIITAIQNNSGQLALFTESEIAEGRGRPNGNGEKVEISRNAQLLLDEWNEEKSWNKFISSKRKASTPVRFGLSGLLRIQFAGRYLLIYDSIAGQYKPLGGGLKFHEKGRRKLEKLKTFQPWEDADDIRRHIPFEQIESLNKWVEGRSLGRETHPLREFFEEMSRENNFLNEQSLLAAGWNPLPLPVPIPAAMNSPGAWGFWLHLENLGRLALRRWFRVNASHIRIIPASQAPLRFAIYGALESVLAGLSWYLWGLDPSLIIVPSVHLFMHGVAGTFIRDSDRPNYRLHYGSIDWEATAAAVATGIPTAVFLRSHPVMGVLLYIALHALANVLIVAWENTRVQSQNTLFPDQLSVRLDQSQEEICLVVRKFLQETGSKLIWEKHESHKISAETWGIMDRVLSIITQPEQQFIETLVAEAVQSEAAYLHVSLYNSNGQMFVLATHELAEHITELPLYEKYREPIESNDGELKLVFMDKTSFNPKAKVTIEIALNTEHKKYGLTNFVPTQAPAWKEIKTAPVIPEPLTTDPNWREKARRQSRREFMGSLIAAGTSLAGASLFAQSDAAQDQLQALKRVVSHEKNDTHLDTAHIDGVAKLIRNGEVQLSGLLVDVINSKGERLGPVDYSIIKLGFGKNGAVQKLSKKNAPELPHRVIEVLLPMSEGKYLFVQKDKAAFLTAPIPHQADDPAMVNIWQAAQNAMISNFNLPAKYPFKGRLERIGLEEELAPPAGQEDERARRIVMEYSPTQEEVGVFQKADNILLVEGSTLIVAANDKDPGKTVARPFERGKVAVDTTKILRQTLLFDKVQRALTFHDISKFKKHGLLPLYNKIKDKKFKDQSNLKGDQVNRKSLEQAGALLNLATHSKNDVGITVKHVETLMTMLLNERVKLELNNLDVLNKRNETIGRLDHAILRLGFRPNDQTNGGIVQSPTQAAPELPFQIFKVLTWMGGDEFAFIQEYDPDEPGGDYNMDFLSGHVDSERTLAEAASREWARQFWFPLNYQPKGKWETVEKENFFDSGPGYPERQRKITVLVYKPTSEEIAHIRDTKKKLDDSRLKGVEDHKKFLADSVLLTDENGRKHWTGRDEVWRIIFAGRNLLASDTAIRRFFDTSLGVKTGRAVRHLITHPSVQRFIQNPSGRRGAFIPYLPLETINGLERSRQSAGRSG